MIKEKIYIYTFYRFKKLTEIKSVKEILNKTLKNKLILGTVLLAKEGINGTISGTRNDLDEFINESDLILANRLDSRIKFFKEKILTRDIFHTD